MQCKCGGSTTLRTQTLAYKVIGEFEACTTCGRIEWLWRGDRPKLLTTKEVKQIVNNF